MKIMLKAKTKAWMNTSMEILGGREPELHLESDESLEDEETFLNTPATIILNKPKRLCAFGWIGERLEGLKSGFIDHNDYDV